MKKISIILLLSILLMSIAYAGEFNESFGTGSWGNVDVRGNYLQTRPSAWLESQPVYTPSAVWDNTWYRWGTGGYDEARPSTNPAFIDTPTGMFWHGYTNSLSDAGIAHVFADPISFDASDNVQFHWTDAGGSSGYVYFIFQQEDGQGGFCIELRSGGFTDCSFPPSDVGCDGTKNTVCVNGGGIGESDTLKSFSMAAVPEPNRQDIKSVEIAVSHSGGGWGDPNVDIAYIDDLYFTFQDSGPICGDGNCTLPIENYLVCPADCNSSCGDGICNNETEIHYGICPDDCPSVCGDTYCEPINESVDTCADDCFGRGGDYYAPEEPEVIEEPVEEEIVEEEERLFSFFSFENFSFANLGRIVSEFLINTRNFAQANPLPVILLVAIIAGLVYYGQQGKKKVKK